MKQVGLLRASISLVLSLQLQVSVEHSYIALVSSLIVGTSVFLMIKNFSVYHFLPQAQRQFLQILAVSPKARIS